MCIGLGRLIVHSPFHDTTTCKVGEFEATSLHVIYESAYVPINTSAVTLVQRGQGASVDMTGGKCDNRQRDSMQLTHDPSFPLGLSSLPHRSMRAVCIHKRRAIATTEENPTWVGGRSENGNNSTRQQQQRRRARNNVGCGTDDDSAASAAEDGGRNFVAAGRGGGCGRGGRRFGFPRGSPSREGECRCELHLLADILVVQGQKNNRVRSSDMTLFPFDLRRVCPTLGRGNFFLHIHEYAVCIRRKM